MAFELFDLKCTLRIHNQMHPRHKEDTDATFGLEVFSPEFKEFLNAGFELYHNAYYLHKGFEGKRIREYQAQLANSGSLSALRKLVSRRAADGKATNSFLLREKKGKANPSLNEGFAHYTHYALLEAHDYLRTLESKLLYAEKQVRQVRFRLFRRVPQYVIRNYSQYVKKQLSVIHKEYRKLTRAMVSRLTMASEDHTLQHGDVLFRLDPQDLIEDKLTQSSFQDFYNVIKSCGDGESKKQLSKLPWVAMANQLSVNPLLCKPSSIYNLAKLEIVSRHMRVQAKQVEQDEEGFKAALVVADAAQKIVQEEKNNFTEKEESLNRWWRRFFNRKNLSRLSKIQRGLQMEAEYIQKHKAVIQQKLDALKTSPEPKVAEIQEIQNIEAGIKSLEDLLLNSLTARFSFSQESLEYLLKLKAQMLERDIVDVRNLPGLTLTDKTFLGLNKKEFFSLFYEDNRQTIALTLNMIVLLNKEKKVIEKIGDISQQDVRMQKITSDIYRYLEKYGTPEIQATIRARTNHVRPN